MCDYSLMGLPNRLAVSDENLVVHRFPTNTIGLISPSDLAPKVSCEKTRWSFWTVLKNCFSTSETDSVTAVCIPPGSRLLMHDIPAQLREQIDVSPVEPVVFTQLSANANVHRDAVRFQNGREVLLQRLAVGQRVKVLSVSAEPNLPLGNTRESEIFR